jgi:hypothetical protein
MASEGAPPFRSAPGSTGERHSEEEPPYRYPSGRGLFCRTMLRFEGRYPYSPNTEKSHQRT